jgi:hypothetical protein
MRCCASVSSQKKGKYYQGLADCISTLSLCHSISVRILTENFMDRGVDLECRSAFPRVFPLCYLSPSDRGPP